MHERFRWSSAHVRRCSRRASQLIDSIDVTVVNVALPDINSGLGFSARESPPQNDRP